MELIRIERKKDVPKLTQRVIGTKVLQFDVKKRRFSINPDDFQYVKDYFDPVVEKEEQKEVVNA